MSQKFLNVRAVCARYSNISDRTVDRWVQAGILPKPMYIQKQPTGRKTCSTNTTRVVGLSRRPPDYALNICSVSKMNCVCGRADFGINKKMPGKAKSRRAKNERAMNGFSPSGAGMQQQNRPAPLFS
jgi:hypothetical protein